VAVPGLPRYRTKIASRSTSVIASSRDYGNLKLILSYWAREFSQCEAAESVDRGRMRSMPVDQFDRFALQIIESLRGKVIR